MMIHGQYAKYVTCGNIVHLINFERKRKKLGAAAAGLIEENEFVIVGLQYNLETIGRRNGGTAAVEIVVSERIGRHRGLLRAMKKNYRTTLDRCQLVIAAIDELYGVTLSASNNYSHALPVAITQGILDL
jgi:hypothetical protein